MPNLASFTGSSVVNDASMVFFAALKATRMPMIVTDPNMPDNPIVFANSAFIAMTGYEWNELMGRNCRLMQGPATDKDTVTELRLSIQERREATVEILNYKKDGTLFWNALFFSPVFDNEGNLIYLFGSQLYVTRRGEAEEGLRQAQKMEAVGQLTGGIAHDFNNLLTVIQGFTDVVLSDMERGEHLDIRRSTRALRAILHASQRDATLTQHLLAFSRKQRLQGRVVDIVDIIQNLQPLIERTAGGSVTVRVTHPHMPCITRIDPTQAELAIINVLINARDAMPDGSVVSIEVINRSVGVGDCGLNELNPGEYVIVTITDEGTGMPPEVLKKVTEPFFTTKARGKGTGLGLSMVYGFLKQSGGSLRIYSKKGYGTTVEMIFPCEDAPIEPKVADTSRRLSRLSGDETILVVEDQLDVRNYIETALLDLGYNVLCAENTGHALDLIRDNEHIDLLFSDLIMPGGVNGVTLACEARRLRSNVSVLLTTGYAESSIERLDARGVEYDFIQKPYKKNELAVKIRHILDGPNCTNCHDSRCRSA